MIDYNKAWKCFRNAIELRSYGYAYRNIGVMIENGTLNANSAEVVDWLWQKGISSNKSPAVVAARLYRKAIDLTSELDLLFKIFPASIITQLFQNKNEKQLKWTLFIWHWNKGPDSLLDYLSTPDESHYTPMKRVIKHQYYKLAAQLIACFNHQIRRRYPLRMVDVVMEQEESRMLTSLQGRVITIVRELSMPAPEVLFEALNVTNRHRAPHIFSVEHFRDLYENYPLIKPLIELSKLMKLGHHRLSGRPGYGVENENAEDIISSEHCFKIDIDWNSGNVADLFFFQGHERAAGVARASEHSSIRNTISVAARITENTQRSVGM